MLFRSGSHKNIAFPTSQLFRIEEFSNRSLSRTGNTTVVPYRNAALPLVTLSQILAGNIPEEQKSDSSTARTIIIHHNERLFGFCVDEIIDIVQCNSNPEEPTPPLRGISGNVLIGDRIVSVLDTESIIQDYIYDQSKAA